MIEFAAITAGIALLLSIWAVLLDRTQRIRIERIGLREAEIRAQLVDVVEAIAKLTVALPAPRLIEVEGICRALKEQYDQVVTAFEQHRAAVHRSIQRFDQIMRRDEKAAAVIESAKVEADEGLDIDPEAEEIPDTQEGDRSFLQTPEEVATILKDRNGGTWDERRRAMSREYHANRGGKFVRSGPAGVPRE